MFTLNSTSMLSKLLESSDAGRGCLPEPMKMLSRWLQVLWTSNQMEMTGSPWTSALSWSPPSGSGTGTWTSSGSAAALWLSSASPPAHCRLTWASWVPVRGCGSARTPWWTRCCPGLSAPFGGTGTGSAGSGKNPPEEGPRVSWNDVEGGPALRKPKYSVPMLFPQWPTDRNNPNVPQWVNGLTTCGVFI